MANKRNEQEEQAQPTPQITTMTVEYIVRQPFTYAGKKLAVDDRFVPAGYKFDGKIIEQGRLVRRVEKAVEMAEIARRTQ